MTRRALIQRVLANGFLLLVPLLVWNAMFWPRLPAGAGGLTIPPTWIGWTENILRVLVFASPVFLGRDTESRQRGAWLAYVLGHVLYFASWLPWLRGTESQSAALVIGPYLTPLIVFLAIAKLCTSRPYALVASLFIATHVSAGLVRAGIW